MLKSEFSYYFEESIRQLQYFHDEVQKKLTILQEENQELKKELLDKESNSPDEYRLSLSLILDILYKMNFEGSITIFLRHLFNKVEPKLLLKELAEYVNLQFESNEHTRFEEVMSIYIEMINGLPRDSNHYIVEFVLLLEKMLIFDYADLDEMDNYYRVVLEAMVNVQQDECNLRIRSFLKDEFDLTSSYLINSNQPELISKYMCALLFHGLENELSIFYKQMVLFEWPFLDANVDKQSYYRFLWYGVLLKLDDQLVAESKEALVFLSNKEPEIELYTLIYDLRNRNKTIRYEDLSKIEKLLAETSFYEHEQEAIASLLFQEVKAELEVAISNQIVAFSNQLTDSGSLERKVLVDPAFEWPSTEAEETTSPGSNDGLFKEESNLRRLGYRITGLNRLQRWDILVRKVIPRLPLKEIVYTIANNVKLRKRQVGGKDKFAYAISEWEHDLKRLKQEYYKSNFTWPQY
jgi:hypothetical protein